MTSGRRRTANSPRHAILAGEMQRAWLDWHRNHSRPISTAARPIELPVDRDRLRRAVLRAPGGFALESLGHGSTDNRFSFFGHTPVRVVQNLPHPPDRIEDAFSTLAGLVRPARRFEPCPDVPFIGGWVGFLAYEAGGVLELRARPSRLLDRFPLSSWGLYDGLIVRDAEADRWWAVAAEVKGVERSPAARCDELVAFAKAAMESRGSGVPSRRVRSAAPEWRSDFSRAEFMARVRAALEYIAAGDIFQVNLAQRFSAAPASDPVAVYERLCRANPASFAAFVPCGEGRHVISSSPELLLDLREGLVRTRPIKGTRARSGDPRLDAAAWAELSASAKDAAELAMIVDLERNDLGRVCRYGSVRVEDAGSIEALPTVFHRVAAVRGELRDGCDVVDLLRAVFPGGSVTGAPKVRAMQIIDELERSPRGPYCGALGYIGLDGSAMLNLPIRTLVSGPAGLHASVGAGIVADSDPQREYEETLAKAAAMLAVLNDANGGETMPFCDREADATREEVGAP